MEIIFGLKSATAADIITTSVLLYLAITFSYISSEEVISVRSMDESESFWFVGPLIRKTLAPNFEAVSANAKPIFPLEWFPINRTGSIDSKVGPAVIKKVLPFKGNCSEKFVSIKLIISSGSAILPSPTKPLANSPNAGGIKKLP